MSVKNFLTDEFSVVTVQNDEDPELVIAQQRNLIRVEFEHDLKFLRRFQAIAGRRPGQTHCLFSRKLAKSPMLAEGSRSEVTMIVGINDRDSTRGRLYGKDRSTVRISGAQLRIRHGRREAR